MAFWDGIAVPLHARRQRQHESHSLRRKGNSKLKTIRTLWITEGSDRVCVELYEAPGRVTFSSRERRVIRLFGEAVEGVRPLRLGQKLGDVCSGTLSRGVQGDVTSAVVCWCRGELVVDTPTAS